MKNIKIIFLWLLLVVAYVQTGYSQMPDASSNFEKVEISFTTTPENPAICNLNKGVKVKVNEPFIRVYWLAPSGARPLIGQDVTLNEFGKWQVKVEKLINGTTCTHTQELMVRDISDPKLIEEYFISNNFFPVTINREAPNPNTDCEAGLEAVNFNGGQNILLQRENFEGFEDFRPFQGMSYVKTITNNNCLCDDTGESKVAEFESKLGSGDLSVWGHQFFANKDVQIGKLFLKASMSWNASSPSGAHKNRLTNILPTILGGLDTREQGRKLFTNLFMNQPIGGYNVADYCNDPEGCYLTENFLTPSGVAIKLPDGASEFVFASSDKPDGVFEGAIIGMANSDGKQMGYHYKNGAFAGYYNDLLATVMDEIEVAPAPEANDELYAFVTRDCMGCKFVRIAVDNIVNTQDEHGGINLPLKSIVTSRFIPSCKERRFRDNLRTDFYVSYLAPTANLIQVPYNDVQSLKFVAGGYETTNVEEVVGGTLWGFDIKIGEGTTCIYKDYTYDVNTKSYITKTGEEYSAEAAGDKGLEDFGYLLQINNGSHELFYLKNGPNRPKHINGDGVNYHESFTTLTESIGFVPFSSNYNFIAPGEDGDVANCSFCASSEFTKEIIRLESYSITEAHIFAEKIAQLATKYPDYFHDPKILMSVPLLDDCLGEKYFTQFKKWDKPIDFPYSVEKEDGTLNLILPKTAWIWGKYLVDNPSVLQNRETDFLKLFIVKLLDHKGQQKQWWADVANKTSEEIICHLRVEPQNVTKTVGWSDKEIALNKMYEGNFVGLIADDEEYSIVHILSSSGATEVLSHVEQKGIKYYYDKFHDVGGGPNFTRVITLISSKINELYPIPLGKVQQYYNSSTNLPGLEGDLRKASNLDYSFEEKNIIKINNIEYNYYEYIGVEVTGTFTVDNITYPIGSKLIVPAVQAALLAHVNNVDVREKAAWVALDLGFLVIGYGGLKMAYKAASVWEKAFIVADVVGSSAGLVVQFLDNDAISQDARDKIQWAAMGLSIPGILASFDFFKKVVKDTRNMKKSYETIDEAIDAADEVIEEAAKLDLKDAEDALDFVLTHPRGGDAWSELLDYSSRSNRLVLERWVEFDELQLPWQKINPHTNQNMFDPNSGGYVTVHSGHTFIAGNADNIAEFHMAQAFSKENKIVKLLNEQMPNGIKTPDAEIVGIGIFDFKNIASHATNIETNVKSKILAVHAQAENIALNLGDNVLATPTKVNTGIEQAILTADEGENTLPINIGVVYRDGSTKILTVEQFRNGDRF